MTRLPNLPKRQFEATYAVNKDSVDLESLKAVRRLMNDIIWKGYVPVVGSEDTAIHIRYGDTVYMTITMDGLDWPEGVKLIKYVTYDGYVEWINTPPSKSRKS